jgi:hypothetical protein
MSRRLQVNSGGLNTVYRCNECGTATVLSPREEPSGWTTGWSVPQEVLPGVRSLGRLDLCPQCSAARQAVAGGAPGAASVGEPIR